MKKILFIAALMLSAVATNLDAQNFRWGVKAGLNITSVEDANIPIDVYDEADLDSKVGIYAGVMAQYFFTKEFGLESGLYFAQMGGKEKELEYYGGYKISANPSYLQLPIQAIYRFQLNKDLHLYPALGVYLGYGLGGNTKIDTYTMDGVRATEKTSYFKNYANRFDMGVAVGVNLEYKKFILGVAYDRGFLKVNKHSYFFEDDNAYNSATRISLGYFF